MRSSLPSIALVPPVFSLVLLLLSSVNLSGQEVPAQARRVAIDHLSRMITVYREPGKSKFALLNMKLDSIGQLSRASLGEPYEVLMMSLSEPDTISDPADFAGRASFLYYEFPIIIDGLAHGVIRVAERNETWEAIGGGGAEDIYNHLIYYKTFKSRCLIHLGPNIIFALVEKGEEYYIIPANPHSAKAFGVSQSCSTIPYKIAMRAFSKYRETSRVQ